MLVKITGAEKFMLFRFRNNLRHDDFNTVLGGISNVVLSNWSTGKSIPNHSSQRAIYEFSKKTTLIGKYSLVMSPNDWRTTSNLHIFCGELLRIWRTRKNITLDDMVIRTRIRKETLLNIERGQTPTQEQAEAVESTTLSFIKKDDWQNELNEL